MGSSRNEGEGNKTADRNYRKATTEFVESERGKREIEKAGNVSPSRKRIFVAPRSKPSNAPRITILKRCPTAPRRGRMPHQSRDSRPAH